MAPTNRKLLIRGGQVYDHDGDVHHPPVADILVADGRIAAVGSNLAADGEHDVIDASGRLVVPGLINAHYHSHDTLCRGLFEELPLEMWLLYTLPMGRNRSHAEVRARTLVGALESLRCGITTVQDMLGLIPLNDEYTDIVLSAYRESGIRVVFSPMVADLPPIAMVRHQDNLPADVQEMLGALAALAEKHDLPLYTHVYETKGQALIARELYADHGGSLITYLENAGMLGPRLNIVHSVWITRGEMDRMAAAGAGIVLNHLSNLKLKSGIAPVCDLREAGVRLGLGCDNCSGSDVQSVFQAMKMFCLIAAASEPEPGKGLAHEVLRHATLGNARTAGLENELGAIRPGYRADLILIDLNDVAYLPFNSAARQLVYTEAGRGVESVIVEGRVVIRERKVTTIDEDALRREVASLMRHFTADYEAVVQSRKRALPYMLEAHRRVWQADVGMNRFIPRTR